MSGDSKKAICILCNKKVIDIRNMAISALVSLKKKNEKHEKQRDLNSLSTDSDSKRV